VIHAYLFGFLVSLIVVEYCRLGKAVSMVSSKQEDINLKLGFQHLINELSGLMGTVS